MLGVEGKEVGRFWEHSESRQEDLFIEWVWNTREGRQESQGFEPSQVEHIAINWWEVRRLLLDLLENTAILSLWGPCLVS